MLSILALGAATAADLESETGQLESLRRNHKIGSAQALRLGELYFLTSRCDEVEKIVKQFPSEAGNALTCACGEACSGSSELARLSRFRADLKKKMRWKDSRLIGDFRRVQHLPEARYWALKYLRSSPASFKDPALRATRNELEKSLESLEVKP